MQKMTVPFEVKEMDSNDNYFTFQGYASTFGNIDEGNDIVIAGAFSETLDEIKKSGVNIPILWQHDYRQPIGVFTDLNEDKKGLFVNGQMPKDDAFVRDRVVPQLRIGSIKSLSIGYGIKKDGSVYNNGIRELRNLKLYETSLVTFPMNSHANITAVKSVVSFQDLPLADRQRPWDSGQAVSRLRAFTDSDDEPSRSYRRGFVWFDSDAPENFESYKLPIADVVDGRLMAVPRAIFAAAAAMRGARGGINIPASDRSAVINHLERYYQKLDLESPFGEASFRIDDLLAIDARTLEGLCKDGIRFTNQGAKQIISNFKTAGLLRYEQAVRRDGVMDKANEILTLLEG